LYAATGGRGADGAVLAVPSQAALAQAVALTRPGARILLFAHTRKGESVALDAGAVTVEDKTLLGCYSADVDLQGRAARLVFSRRVRVKELIRQRFPLAKIRQAFARAINPTPRSLKVVVQP
jgi:L-iditol 2-dehydrogenase